MLPTDFINMMQPLLGSEWDDFVEAMHLHPTRGVRLHRLKKDLAINQTVNDKNFNIIPIRSIEAPKQPIPSGVANHLLQKVPWCENGYYVDLHSPLGKSAYHEAGAYYLQEPSAMAVVEALDPKPGEQILDLCAAPGGKCTEIGRRLTGKGLLVANEIHPSRVVILAENIERLGIPAVVTQESADRLSQVWSECFDAILVDAPCSGEGMFRKERLSMNEWSKDAPLICSNRQKQILESALKLIRPGGRIVYSTCTFNPYENEQIVDWMVKEHGYEVEQLPEWTDWSNGVPEWGSGNPYLLHCRRLWPHLAIGEGHFVARLRKPESWTNRQEDISRIKVKNKSNSSQNAAWCEWAEQHFLCDNLPATWEKPITHGTLLFSSDIFLLPKAKLKILRPGTALASIERHGIVPQHALAMSLSANSFQNSFMVSEEEALAYCAGHTLIGDGYKGFRHISLHGLPLGWGKGLENRINNLHPKGLRRQNLVILDNVHEQ